jgi:hypothetical protein
MSTKNKIGPKNKAIVYSFGNSKKEVPLEEYLKICIKDGKTFLVGMTTTMLFYLLCVNYHLSPCNATTMFPLL